MDINSKVIPLHLHPLGFIEAFTHFGADLPELLKNTGINENMLGSKGVKISYAQQHALIGNGIRLCNKPGIGLLVGQFMEWSYNGPIGAIVNCSPSLRDAGEAFVRYLMIAQPYYAMYLTKPKYYVDDQGMIIGPIRYFVADNKHPELQLFECEYRLAVTLRLLDMCGNKSVENTDVHVGLQYPEPAHGELYRQLPCTSVKFNCEQSYIASHFTFVTTPWRMFRKHAYDRILAQCEEEFKQTNIETTYKAKVRWHVSTLFNQHASLEKVAEILGLSPRALTRKLASEGTSFRNIMHDVRMEIVSLHLQESKLSVEKIASIMGFSSASSLRRAIKNWSGNSVSYFRSETPHIGLNANFNKQREAG
ncbi:AraC family transcriptional regulator [Aurantivibrio infirmus]